MTAKDCLKFICAALVIFGLTSCKNQTANTAEQEAPVPARRIVSLAGSLSEVLADLGLAEELVGVDVTTTYPESLQNLPRIGHVRNLSVEGVLSLQPTVLVGFEEELALSSRQQLETAGVELILVQREYSPEGVIALFEELGERMARVEAADAAIKRFRRELETAGRLSQSSRGLFIYARGAGTLMVAGTNSAADAMLELIGADNAVASFEGFKPLTAEAVASANPDFIFMFDSGLESMGGVNGILEVPGVSLTTAGQQGRIITMDGQLLLGFGPRLPQAMTELTQKIESFSSDEI